MAITALNKFFIKYEFWQIHQGLHFLLTSFILAKFPKNQTLIVMLSIKCLNFKFCGIKICTKNKFIDWIVNNRINFGYKICYSLKLKLQLISFYWVWILTIPPLNYIFFIYLSCLQNFQKINTNSYIIN